MSAGRHSAHLAFAGLIEGTPAAGSAGTRRG